MASINNTTGSSRAGSFQKRESPPFKRSTTTNQNSRRISLMGPSGTRLSPTKIRSRITQDTRKAERLSRSTCSTLRNSNFFEPGIHKDKEKLLKLSEDFVEYVRSPEALAKAGSYALINQLKDSASYRDVYKEERVVTDRGDFDDLISIYRNPTPLIQQELEAILEKHYGLFEQFHQLLRQEHLSIKKEAEVTKRWTDLEVHPKGEPLSAERLADTASFMFWVTALIGSLGTVHFLSPRMGDELKDVFSELLAKEWLEEDRNRLLLHLKELPLKIHKPLSQLPHVLNTFELQEQTYGIISTKPDGACALHALLGEEVDGQYEYQGDVKALFADILRERKNEEQVQEHLLSILKEHLSDANSIIDKEALDHIFKLPDSKKKEPNKKDKSARNPFISQRVRNILNEWNQLNGSLQIKLDPLDEQEAELWKQALSDESNEELRTSFIASNSSFSSIFSERSQEESSELDLSSILNTARSDRDVFMTMLDGISQTRMTAIDLEKEKLRHEQNEEERKFLLKNRVLGTYLQTLQDPEFFLNTEEIELAAVLFNKKAVVIKLEGNTLIKATDVINPHLQGDSIVIFHESEHFSRCRPITNNELNRLEFQRMAKLYYTRGKQKAIHAVLKDKKAREILNASLKEAFAHLSVSGGLSFMTANPLPIATQAVRSGANVLTAYADPFQDSSISQYANMSAVPAFELLRGMDPTAVITSLTVDLCMKEALSRENGRLPESLRKMASSSIAGLILRDPDKIVSGMFGVAVGEGMERARLLLQDKELHDPDMSERLVRAFFTNEELQGAVVKSFMTALEEEKASQDPVINLEVERHLEINSLELAHAKALLVEKEAGVAKAQEKVDEKFQNSQEAGSVKEVDKAQKRLNSAHNNLNNFTRERDAQQKVVDALKAKDVDLRNRLYSPIEEQDYLNRTTEEHSYNLRLQAAHDALIQKNAGVANAAKYLEDKQDEYNKNCHKDKYYSKLKQAIKNYNNALTERDAAINTLYGLQGINTWVSTPHVKIPERASTWEKTKLWIDENVEINIGINFSRPLYEIKPLDRDRPFYSPSIKENTQTPVYEPTNTNINQPTDYNAPTEMNWGWESYQNYRNDLMMQTVENSIAERNQRQLQLNLPQPLDLINPTKSITAEHRELFGKGFYEQSNSQIKQYPQGQDLTASNIPKWLRHFAGADHLSLDHQERIDMNSQQLVANIHSLGKIFGGMVDEVRSFGAASMWLDGSGRIKLLERNVSDQIANKIDSVFQGVSNAPNFHHLQLTSDVMTGLTVDVFVAPLFGAFFYMKPTTIVSPLTGRSLVLANNGSRELSMLQRLNRPVYRSGLGFANNELVATENAVAQLAGREIKTLVSSNASRNYQYVHLIENGEKKIVSIGEMSHAGTFQDRGGLTKAGRALDKHGQRIDTVFPKATGNVHQKNMEGQRVLDEILNHPNKVVKIRNDASARMGGEVIDIRLPDGRGARFTKDGKEMKCFLEPN